MNLRQLQLLVAIDEKGSFSAAGDAIGMAQPAVSLAIKKLEGELGLSLFHREGKSVRFTQAGDILLTHALAIQQHLTQSRQSMQALRGLQAGRVHLGAPAMVAGHWLPEGLIRFASQYPEIQLHQYQAGVDAIAERIRRGQLDFGIIADWSVNEELETRPLQRIPLVACVPTDSPWARRRSIDWHEVFAQRLLLFPRGYHVRERLEAQAKQHGHVLEPALEAETVSLLLALTARGLGTSIALDVAVAQHPHIVGCPLADGAHVRIALCRRRGGVLSPAAQALWDGLVAYASDGG